ncbi:uncharacterized protein LOC134257086 [Saccostrea cucullata]|uniref:uncharacterized protein LOC134257086 n=1 Tax=Saccostrea cuccullata TaxID=36930 RepID=UPI002ED4A5C5
MECMDDGQTSIRKVHWRLAEAVAYIPLVHLPNLIHDNHEASRACLVSQINMIFRIICRFKFIKDKIHDGIIYGRSTTRQSWSTYTLTNKRCKWTSHEDKRKIAIMSDIENYEFSVDFQTAATKELGFLKTIDEYPSLYGGPALKYAIFSRFAKSLLFLSYDNASPSWLIC